MPPLLQIGLLAALAWLCPLAALAQNPPLPPAQLPAASPVEDFRRWLRLSPAEAEAALAGKSPEQKTNLLHKLREYSALPEEEREQRLRMVEMRWYQQYFTRLEGSTPEQRALLLGGFSPEYRKKLEEQLNFWKITPPDARQKMLEQFLHFSELPAGEKRKTLAALSEADRQEMEKTLQAFSRLSREQRRLCIESFGKLAQMSPEERRQFLSNAERWQSMSPEERATWRGLVHSLPPLPVPPPPMPRLPTAALGRAVAPQSNTASAGPR